MAKTNKTQEDTPETLQTEDQQGSASQQQPSEEKTPDVVFTGVFNGDSLSFDVPNGTEGIIAVEINEKPWGEAALQSPLTVVRGTPLPGTYRLSFSFQPIQ